MTIYQTSGNPYGHIIMRGGKNRTTTLKILPPPATRCMNLICRNIWSSTSATATVKNSIAASWRYVMIFASRFVMAPRQLPGLWPRVFTGRHAKIISGQPLIYGQSITDPCLNWEDTEVLLKTCRGGRQPLNSSPILSGWAFLRCVTRPFLSRAYITPQN